MSRIIADGLSNKATATTQEAQDAVSGKYPDAAGVYEAFKQYGLGALNSIVPAGDNIDDVNIPAGIAYRYDGDTLGTTPPNSTFGVYWTGKLNAASASQIAVDWTTGQMFSRSNNGGGWSSWNKIFSDNNVATTSENQAASRNDVPTTPKGIKEYVDQFGINSYVTAVTTDLNTLETPGTGYWINLASTNKPSGSNSGFLWVNSGANNVTITQTFYESQTTGYPQVWFRGKNTSTGNWNAWVEVFHSGNVATTTENQEATRNDVPTTPQGIKEYVDQFGVGRDVGQLLPTGDLDSASNETGTYIYLSSHTGAPSAANGQVWLSKTTSPSADGQAQIAVDRNGKMFFRIFTALPAPAWTEVADVNDIVTYTAGSGIQLVGSEFSLSDETYTTTEKNKLADLENVNLTGGTNVSISGTYPNLTVDATDTDTTYSAGNGISLSGTTFSVAAGDGLTQEASGLAVDATVVRDSDIGTNAERDVLIQTTEPTSGQGADGDICYVYTP